MVTRPRDCLPYRKPRQLRRTRVRAGRRRHGDPVAPAPGPHRRPSRASGRGAAGLVRRMGRACQALPRAARIPAPPHPASRAEVAPGQPRTDCRPHLLEPNGSATRLVNEIDIEAPSAARRLAASLAVSRIKAAVAANLTELTRILERLFHQPLEERVSMSWTGTRDTGAGQVSLTIRTHPAAEWRIAGGAER